jgi:hypothetical protein
MVGAACVGFGLSQMYLNRSIGLRTKELLIGCVPALAVTVLSVGPLALSMRWYPSTENSYWSISIFGGLTTALIWLVCLRVTKHELWAELTTLLGQLTTLLRRTSDAREL